MCACRQAEETATKQLAYQTAPVNVGFVCINNSGYLMIQLIYDFSVWRRMFLRGLKQTELEADHPSPYSVEVKHSCTFNFLGVLLNKRLDKFALQRSGPYRAVTTICFGHKF
jgi:hypothetical protein